MSDIHQLRDLVPTRIIGVKKSCQGERAVHAIFFPATLITRQHCKHLLWAPQAVSDLLVEIFGAEEYARSVFGATSLRAGMPVTVKASVEIRSS